MNTPAATISAQPDEPRTAPRASDGSDAPIPPDSPTDAERQHTEDQLDEALDLSFPASDPIAVTPGDR
jgi:hypothetical protein